VNRHTREIHVDPSKMFACDLCPKRFKRKEHFKRHVRGKHLYKKFKCCHCSSEHVEKSRLKAHLQKVHCLKTCSQCGIFLEKKLLKTHTCTQSMLDLPLHIVKYGVLFDCKDCLTCFLDESSLTTHLCSKAKVEKDSASAAKKDCCSEDEHVKHASKTAQVTKANNANTSSTTMLKKRSICDAETQPNTPQTCASVSQLPKKKLKRLELSKIWNPFQSKTDTVFGASDALVTPSPFKSGTPKNFMDFFGNQDANLDDDLASALGFDHDDNQSEKGDGFICGLLNDCLSETEEVNGFRFDLNDIFTDKTDFEMHTERTNDVPALNDYFF